MPQDLLDHINAKHRASTMAQIIAGTGMGLCVVALVVANLSNMGIL